MGASSFDALSGTWDGENTQHRVVLLQPSRGIMLEIGGGEQQDCWCRGCSQNRPGGETGPEGA